MRELSSYLESDSAFAQALLSSFMDNIAGFRQEFLQAVKAQEEKQYMAAYHKIKTTLGYSGNTKLKEHCELITEIIKTEGIAAVDARLQNYICRLCTSSIEELQKQLIHYTSKHENISV